MIAFRLRVSWKEDFIFHGSYRFSFAAVHLPYVKGTVIKEFISYIIKVFNTILFRNYIYENFFIKKKFVIQSYLAWVYNVQCLISKRIGTGTENFSRGLGVWNTPLENGVFGRTFWNIICLEITCYAIYDHYVIYTVSTILGKILTTRNIIYNNKAPH